MWMAIAETLSEMWRNVVGQGAKNSGQLWNSEDSLSPFVKVCVAEHSTPQTPDLEVLVQALPITLFL